MTGSLRDGRVQAHCVLGKGTEKIKAAKSVFQCPETRNRQTEFSMTGIPQLTYLFPVAINCRGAIGLVIQLFLTCPGSFLSNCSQYPPKARPSESSRLNLHSPRLRIVSANELSTQLRQQNDTASFHQRYFRVPFCSHQLNTTPPIRI